ncbi:MULTISPECIES: glycosyl transferase family 1 [unclassified Mesorhizobium]|uniref:glycosyl transferase family 1 n=1 Tax=unclassified Mesorhizobium TaxID=325217 RepID=UPI000F74F343|nr:MULTISPECIES: glycosyl transferase family 1 [unclassified Mesorhizobium]AZO04858.1 glycosyl transferase family 1 [Mesorhizobium sp. M2A.F.Ca.ET.043.02.1.1]RUW43091.1 glycosyl transferase family 1 [Mesorhizobium sp. M2A.F.Ca.ET.015.02.1.1]RUW77651.1 glycosyl transferase family 1 [Mesorhizobium sp. M2A.F.Ca.ET.067.02.1.1]RVC93484.1 glycosyl transferase family 1 [Mesorhizobium sp. M2A.F.Ca.ET.017.03.2.1]RVD08441.1 glycosyl transferase family 1 [Mesorhizobium sp. M2A.F.Ca.ET.029.05.1.1]
MLHVLYLVHDVSDPAVRRRVQMLKAGGAGVTLAGFRRTASPVAEIEGSRPVDLGATRDGRFAQRLGAVAKAAMSIGAKLGVMPRPDLIIARNLEMLALARRANAALGANVPIVYECLDIHRLVLRDDLVGRTLRGAERHLARDVKLLVTSSPAFIANYFEPFGQIGAPVELIENKYFEAASVVAAHSFEDDGPATPPWRIGWFGALRCRRSLELVADFTRRQAGRFEVVLRGRPALSEFPDFHGFVEAEPWLSFGGPYRNPEDMAAIYGEVHFSWAIDFFEAGQNSEWLLPNRLYEGCRFGAVPISMAGTETGRFLKGQDIGVLLSEATPEGLEAMLGRMDQDRYRALKSRVLARNPRTWSYDRSDCAAFVEKLRGLTAMPSAFAAAA